MLLICFLLSSMHQERRMVRSTWHQLTLCRNILDYTQMQISILIRWNSWLVLLTLARMGMYLVGELMFMPSIWKCLHFLNCSSFRIINNYLSSGRIVLLYLFMVMKLTVVNAEPYHCCRLLYIRILFNVLPSRLISYVDKIIENHHRGFQRNRSTTDHILCISQILEKIWKYSGTLHWLFIDLKEA
jgi:hypothetical protein